MAKDKLTDYSATNASNTDVGGVNINEGMLPSDVNNAIREVMTHLKDFAEGTEAVNSLAVDNININGNTISSTDTNGNINITPNGSGAVAFTTNATFGDNDKAIFGAGNDLQIYHDGSASRIVDAGTGGLTLQADANVVIQNSAGTETKAEFTTDGAVNLYHDNSPKLATTSSGVSVTGNIVATGTTGGVAKLRLAAEEVHGEIEGINIGNNFGGLAFKTNSNGTTSEVARLDSSGRLGLGTSSPSYKFHSTTSSGSDIAGYFHNSAGSGNGTSLIARGGANNATPNFQVQDYNGNADFTVIGTGLVGIGTASPNEKLTIDSGALSFLGSLSTPSIGAGIFRPANNTLAFVTGSGERMRIDSSGRVGIGDNAPNRLLQLKATGTGDTQKATIMFENEVGTTGSIGQGPASDNSLIFTENGSERARLTSDGKFRLNATANQVMGYERFTCNGAAGFRNGDASVVGVWQTQTSAFAMQFFSGANGNNVGSISVTQNSTAFNTSSDRRLKSNIENAASASDKIDAIQVRQFDWNLDDSHQDYGLIAQELQPIEPLAVTGDADSDEMMAVDYSKLVPMLIKEIQELRGRVAALEAN